MKPLFMTAVLFLSIANVARADQLLCASKKNEPLYYSTGQIKLTAEIADTTTLSMVTLRTSGSGTLGSSESEVFGKIHGDYVRFEIGGDAWCSYKLALPKDFKTREQTWAYVDAHCEENANSSIRLNCSIQ